MDALDVFEPGAEVGRVVGFVFEELWRGEKGLMLALLVGR